MYSFTVILSIAFCPCLVWIDVASLKHYLNAIKAKQGALNARKPMVGGREPTSALGPSGLALIGIQHLLLSNLTTGDQYAKHSMK